MEIRQFRVVIRAKRFDRTCRFYEESLALPRLQSWDRDDSRGARFQAGSAVIEVLGRPTASEGPLTFDETYDYVGPEHKVVLTFEVPSARKTYDEIFFRDKNVPGGLRQDAEGVLLFETHDPDGVRVIFREE